MRIGMIGLGKMGGNMTTRLQQDGHEVVVFDIDPDAVARAEADGAQGAATVADLVDLLDQPRVVWVMVPSGDITRSTLTGLGDLLDQGDVVVDGGNSRFSDTQAAGDLLAEQGIELVDAGTSGGVWGLTEGYSLMVGGSPDAVAAAQPALESLAPTNGWAHVGPRGAGHFTKMVHNGIEYALMQSYAEGFELLGASDFGFDLHQVAEVWRHGSVIRSWLLDLAADALAADPGLDQLDAWVPDSGEGRWTVQTAIDLAVPTPTIAAALFNRFASRDENPFGQRLLAALRQQFGGHAVRAADPDLASHHEAVGPTDSVGEAGRENLNADTDKGDHHG